MAKNINIPLTRKQVAIVLGVVVVAAILFFVVRANLQSTEELPSISLTVWGTDSRSDWRLLVQSYEEFRSNVDLAYEQVPADRYEEELLSALAAGRGPDLFFLPNRQVAQRAGIITPLDLQYFGLKEFRESFPDVAEQDFVQGSEILALPLYIDTLAMLYNRDALNQAGIAEPPSTWGQLQQAVPSLRRLNPQGQIVRAAAAIGGSRATVPHAVDLVHLLMLQNGANIIGNQGRAIFASQEEGIGAFEFYLQFANAGSSVYTWNDNQSEALASFVAGDTAITFGYQSDAQTIPSQNPFLRYGVAPMPQVNPSAAVNYARYQGLSVSNQSENPAWAWDAAVYFTSNKAAQELYTNLLGRPPALRSVISEVADDPDLGVFANQSLTARSWPIVDYDETVQLFNQAIVDVLTGRSDLQTALKQAENQMNLIR